MIRTSPLGSVDENRLRGAWHRLSQQGDAGQPDCKADPELLSQAILNLLHNSVDFVGETHHPSITLSCDRVDSEIVFGVADNGRGSAPDRSEEIFVPFYTTKPGGSGMGVA